MYPGHWSKICPDKPAIIHSETGDVVTYKALDDRSNQLAQLMWSQGLRRGDHVAIFMENDMRYFDMVWAAMRSGLYLTTVNRYLTTEEAAYIIDNSESQIVVTSNYLGEIAGDFPAQCPRVKQWLMTGEPLDGFDDYEQALAQDRKSVV